MFKLFVANINGKVTEATFEHFLSQSGIQYARLRMPDPAPGFDCHNRGFAFISFETRADYDAAASFLHGKEFAGKLLRVAEAHDKRPAPVRHDHYAANSVETRRSSPTVKVAPDYRDYPPSHTDMRDKGAL